MVNKKCKEALKILKTCQSLKLKEESSEDERVIPSNLLKILPNIETIECFDTQIQEGLSILEEIKQVKLYSLDEHFIIPDILKEKLIFIYLDSCEIVSFDPKEYPNLRQLKIDFYGGDLKEYLGDCDLMLNKLLIKAEKCSGLKILKDYKNIKMITIIVRQEITKEEYRKLSSFAQVRVQKCQLDDDFRQLLYFDRTLILSSNKNIEEIYNLSLFYKCFVLVNCDLRKCCFLESVATPFHLGNICIKVEGLKRLKTIKRVFELDCIPSSVVKLVTNSLFNFGKLLLLDKNCFSSIQELDISGNVVSYENKSLLSHFSDCKKMTIGYFRFSDVPPIELPTTLEYLSIHHINEDQIDELMKLDRLTNLCISADGPIGLRQKNQLLLNSLPRLQSFKCNSVFLCGVELPPRIKNLRLTLVNDTNLMKCSGLREIELSCYGVEPMCVYLPTNLERLSIYCNVIVSNSSSVQLEVVSFFNTPSQNLDWNAKHLIVVQGYDVSE